MPKEYTSCRDSLISKGVPTKEAKGRCAAVFFKRHGITVQEAKKKGLSTLGLDEDVDLDFAELLATEETTEMEGVSIDLEGKDLFDDDGLITVVAAKVGSKARAKVDGEWAEFFFTEFALKKYAETYIGGTVGVNHISNDGGTILSSRYDEEVGLIQTIKANGDLTEHIIKHVPKVGVSTEGIITKVNKKNEIKDFIGTGLTFVTYPATPACKPDQGCGILGTDGKEEIIEFTGENILDIFEEILLIGEDFPCDLADEIIDAAVLTTKTRKALPASAFCGPDRSFPAHDKAHVRNALARLNQSKFSPAVKSKIKACLKRKAKKLGVEVSSTEPPITTNEGDKMTSDNPDSDADDNRAVEDLAKLQEELESLKTERDELLTFKDDSEKAARKDVMSKINKLLGTEDEESETYESIDVPILEAIYKDLENLNETNSGAKEGQTDPPDKDKPDNPDEFTDEMFEATKAKELGLRGMTYTPPEKGD